jgi:hypothetical protein
MTAFDRIQLAFHVPLSSFFPISQQLNIYLPHITV